MRYAAALLKNGGPSLPCHGRSSQNGSCGRTSAGCDVTSLPHPMMQPALPCNLGSFNSRCQRGTHVSATGRFSSFTELSHCGDKNTPGTPNARGVAPRHNLCDMHDVKSSVSCVLRQERGFVPRYTLRPAPTMFQSIVTKQEVHVSSFICDHLGTHCL